MQTLDGGRITIAAQAVGIAQAALDAAYVSLGGGEVMLARKQQRDVDRHAAEDRRLDRLGASRRAGDLDEQIGPVRRLVQLGRSVNRLRGVVGDQGRDLQRDPAVDSVGGVVERAEQTRGGFQVVERECEKSRLGGLALAHQARDVVVVAAALAHRVLEDGRVRGQPGHGQIGNVARQRAHFQHVAADVVYPQALAQLVQFSGVGVDGGFHVDSWVACAAWMGREIGGESSRSAVCQPPSRAISASASVGPQLPGS